ncbi:1013_t:CDS:2, partial [Gigaspora rosea]
ISKKTISNTPLPAEDLDDSDVELTKNQNIELDLIRDLRSGSTIASPTEDSEQNSSMESSQITTQSLIFTGVTDKTARTQIYKEMLKHLSGITPVALRIKTLRAKKICKLFEENGVGMDKI